MLRCCASQTSVRALLHQEICVWKKKNPTPPSALCIMIPPSPAPLQTGERCAKKTREKSSFCCCCGPLLASPRRDGNRRLMAYICSVLTAQQKTLTCYRRALSASRRASSLGQTRLSAGPVCDVTRRQVNTVGDVLFISRGFVVVWLLFFLSYCQNCTFAFYCS